MLKNKWSLLLLVFFVFFFLILLSKCKEVNKKWRYEVRGYVQYKGKPHDAIWFTDTLEIGDNFVSYKNSDGSEVVIPAPYVIIDHKYDKVDSNNRNPFR